MAKEEVLELTGTVTELLPNAMFRVVLDNDHEILAHTAGKMRKHRIRVNGINLGWTDTPAEHVVQKKQGSPDNWLEIGEQNSPFGRLLKPDDVARLCLYLLSDESGILTGSNIDYSQRVMGFFPPMR